MENMSIIPPKPKPLMILAEKPNDPLRPNQNYINFTKNVKHHCRGVFVDNVNTDNWHTLTQVEEAENKEVLQLVQNYLADEDDSETMVSDSASMSSFNSAADQHKILKATLKTHTVPPTHKPLRRAAT